MSLPDHTTFGWVSSQLLPFFRHLEWAQLDAKTTRNVLAHNTDCSDALGANKSDSVVLLTPPVDRKLLRQAVLRWSECTVCFIRLLDKSLPFSTDYLNTKILYSSPAWWRSRLWLIDMIGHIAWLCLLGFLFHQVKIKKNENVVSSCSNCTDTPTWFTGGTSSRRAAESPSRGPPSHSPYVIVAMTDALRLARQVLSAQSVPLVKNNCVPLES